jgi:MoxR-like ATPase
MLSKLFSRVSESPTNPAATSPAGDFDVAELYRGPIALQSEVDGPPLPLDEKLRQAYFWIVNHAIISPFYDIEYNDGPPQTFTFGDTQCRVHLPSAQSYCSFVLLPLLAFAARRKCLLVGGPGRGKTASAVLMGVLAGYPLREVRRAIQKGQPQMTVADLLGTPIPADLIQAKSLDQVAIGWRKWLQMRVKIVDEYNRIPTRTQSALLTLMADNYAEVYDQTYECPESAWYLTANDDAGGGTYQVIEALRDRIDIVVKALHFNTRFLGELLTRIEEAFDLKRSSRHKSSLPRASGTSFIARFSRSRCRPLYCGVSNSLWLSLNSASRPRFSWNIAPKIRPNWPAPIGGEFCSSIPVKTSSRTWACKPRAACQSAA